MEFNAILSPLGAFGPMIGGVLLLLLVVKLLSMPFKLVWNVSAAHCCCGSSIWEARWRALP